MAFVPNPKATNVQVNHGKGKSVVTGVVDIVWNGPRTAVVHTAGHHNDDGPAVTYRGKDYLITMHLKRQDDGTWAESADSRSYGITKRGTFEVFNTTPKTIRAAIVAAICATVQANYQDDDGRRAAYANAMQHLDRAQRERDELAAKLAELDASIARHTAEARKNAPSTATTANGADLDAHHAVTTRSAEDEAIRVARYAKRYAARFLAETPEGQVHPEPTDEEMAHRFAWCAVQPAAQWYPAIRDAVNAMKAEAQA